MDPHANMTPQPSANTNSEPTTDGADYYTNQDTAATAINESSPPQLSSQSSLNKKIINLKFLNGTSYLLTTLIVIGHVLWKVHEEGIWGDDYVWMKYQVREWKKVLSIYE